MKGNDIIDDSIQGAEHHAAHSRRLIRQANYELARRGDRVQASEKAAGAVAHGVKALAESRNWRHDSLNRRRSIVHLIAAEYGLPELTAMQAIADQLHHNFYEDLMYDGEVGNLLGQVTSSLEIFMGLWERGPNPDFVPAPEQEIVLRRLRLSEDEIREKSAIDYPPPMPEFVPPED